MKIAFTHNLQLQATEEEAEFDTPETVGAITRALESLGHRVEPVEVTGPVSRIVARLEALNPDLILNTAEGRRGRFREGFYPGVFEQLGLPFTGSDAYVCTLTLDKHLTKLAVIDADIPVPRSLFLDSLERLKGFKLNFPVIVKPNFEGSSKGITQDSVVEDLEQLEARVKGLLKRYPGGLLLEEYIDGRDVTVPFLETLGEGVLEPAEYSFQVAERKYMIYDYELKQTMSHAVQVNVPAQLSPQQRKQLMRFTRRAVRVLGIRDFGRMDYRISRDGKIYFIEANALPSLEPGASIYRSAELAGADSVEAVLEHLLKSAARRFGLSLAKSRRKRTRLRVGLTFNLKRVKPGQDDAEAEFDAPSTVEAIKAAIESFGHEVVELEATPELPAALETAQPDVVFNIAEGSRGRNRESQVPALLELFDIPYTGSDAATLAVTLDKGLAKRLVRQAGVPTPSFLLMVTGKEKIPKDFSYPLILKPVAEGSSKGVVRANVVRSEEELRLRVGEVVERYRQPVLVEEFLPGREFTVALLGEKRPRVLPPMEIVFSQPDTEFPIYSFEHKLDFTREVTFEVPAKVDPALGKALERAARQAFRVLGCRDVARIDLRLDARGTVNFIECNPLPGLSPGFSDLCIIAQAAGIDYRNLIGDILAPALRRLRSRRKPSGEFPVMPETVTVRKE